MPRPSKVDKLPSDVRDAITRLRQDGHTLDEILVYLSKMGLDEDGLPSRSGLHRHVQGLDALAGLISEGQAMSEGLVRRIGEEPENRQARLNIRVMQSLLTRLLVASVDPEGAVNLNAKDLQFLTKALANLSSAEKSDLEKTLRLKKELVAELEKKIAQVEVEATAEALTPAEMIARIRALYAGEA